MTRKTLLVFGILSSVLYVAMNVFIPLQWDGYSSASQTVSELSAIGAPTRPLWVPLGILYTLLVAGFGWGVRESGDRNRPLRIAGGLLVTYGLVGLAWPPMHLREALAIGGGTLTDTMHIVFATVTVLIMMLAIGFGAVALRKHFRRYSIVTLAILLVFGALTVPYAPRLEANLPTPWLGVWERISIAAFLLWVVVLAITLLTVHDTAAIRTSARGAA